MVMTTQRVVYWILLILEKKHKLIAADLSKQKALDADPKTVQQIIFTVQASAATTVFYVLEKSKETVLKFAKGTTKML